MLEKEYSFDFLYEFGVPICKSFIVLPVPPRPLYSIILLERSLKCQSSTFFAMAFILLKSNFDGLGIALLPITRNIMIKVFVYAENKSGTLLRMFLGFIY